MLGIFDSGFGGLTVARQIERRMPRAGFIYVGDTARLPYGTKSPATIERYAVDALRFLRKKGATTPVIACHTVSSLLVTRPEARKRCAKIFGAHDLYEVVTPGIRAAKNATLNGRVGVLGTIATIQSGAYQKGLGGMRVVPVAASALVALAEEGWGRSPAIRPILREIVKPFKQFRVDTVVLACTHFPLFARPIRDILGSSVRIIDPGEELARVLSGTPQSIFEIQSDWGSRKRFFVTDISRDFSRRASRFLGRSVRAQLVNL